MSSDFGNLKLTQVLSLTIVNQKLLLDILNELKSMNSKMKEPKPPKPPKGKK